MAGTLVFFEVRVPALLADLFAFATVFNLFTPDFGGAFLAELLLYVALDLTEDLLLWLTDRIEPCDFISAIASKPAAEP